MSVLTKIFIVLLVVLTIGLSVAVVMVHRDYLAPQRELVDVKNAHEAMAISWKYDKDMADAELKSLRGQITQLQSDVRNRDGDVAKLRVDLQTAQDAAAVKDKDVVALRMEVNQWSARAAKKSDDLTQAETLIKDVTGRYEQTQKQSTALNQRVVQLSAEREFLLGQYQLLKEQIKVLTEKLNNVVAAAPTAEAGGPEARPAASMAGPIIKGKISAVADDMRFATIDVGANDGVTPEMTFEVFHQDKWLATLKVTRVDADKSAGLLEKVQGRVQVNDNAWTRLSTQ